MERALRPHILVSPDEGEKSKERREEAFLKLSDPQKAAVGVANSNCEVTTDGETENVFGRDFPIREILRTKNQKDKTCPVNLLADSLTVLRVISNDKDGENGIASMNIRHLLVSEYKDPELARVAGTTRFQIETFVRGRIEIHPEYSRTFARFKGEGAADLTDGGRLNIYVKGEYLEDKDSEREAIFYLTLVVGPKAYYYAFHAKHLGGLPVIDEFYTGHKKLTAAQMETAGVPELARLLTD